MNRLAEDRAMAAVPKHTLLQQLAARPLLQQHAALSSLNIPGLLNNGCLHALRLNMWGDRGPNMLATGWAHTKSVSNTDYSQSMLLCWHARAQPQQSTLSSFCCPNQACPLTMERLPHSLVQLLAPVHVCQLHHTRLTSQHQLPHQLGQGAQHLLTVLVRHVGAKPPVVVLVQHLGVGQVCGQGDGNGQQGHQHDLERSQRVKAYKICRQECVV